MTGILSKEKTDKRVDRDENLTRILDRLILYLRIVHSVDYYGCKFYDKEGIEKLSSIVLYLYFIF